MMSKCANGWSRPLWSCRAKGAAAAEKSKHRNIKNSVSFYKNIAGTRIVEVQKKLNLLCDLA